MKIRLTLNKILIAIICFMLFLIITCWIFANQQIFNLNTQIETLQLEVSGNSDNMQQSENERKDNPIDEYFNSFDWNGRGSSTLELRVFANMYQFAWREEMIHAYGLLYEKANPRSAVPIEILKSKDSFIEYVESESQVYAYVQNSNVFGDEFGEYSDNITTGTILPATASDRKAMYYRQRTLEIIEMLGFISIDDKPFEFIFKPTKDMVDFFAGNYSNANKEAGEEKE